MKMLLLGFVFWVIQLFINLVFFKTTGDIALIASTFTAIAYIVLLKWVWQTTETR